MATHRCEHRHSYIEHNSCYKGMEERIGFLDIEASNLDADFGIMLSYCIKDSKSTKIYEGVITKQDIDKAQAGDEDRRLVAQCIEDIGRFDRIVTYYGKRFDIPYIRTRAVTNDVPFPYYGTLVHTDLYFTLKFKFKLSSNRLENACRVLLHKTDKTRVDSRYWRGGQRGDKKSLDYILDHNRKDVWDLEKLYNKVVYFSKQTDSSI